MCSGQEWEGSTLLLFPFPQSINSTVYRSFQSISQKDCFVEIKSWLQNLFRNEKRTRIAKNVWKWRTKLQVSHYLISRLIQRIANKITRPWRKNSGSTGAGDFESEVAQLCPTLRDPMDYSLPDSSVHGISQARMLEWVAIFFSMGSSWPRDQTCISCIAGSLLHCRLIIYH